MQIGQDGHIDCSMHSKSANIRRPADKYDRDTPWARIGANPGVEADGGLTLWPIESFESFELRASQADDMQQSAV